MHTHITSVTFYAVQNQPTNSLLCGNCRSLPTGIEYQFRLRFLKGVGQWLVVEFLHTCP